MASNTESENGLVAVYEVRDLGSTGGQEEQPDKDDAVAKHATFLVENSGIDPNKPNDVWLVSAEHGSVAELFEKRSQYPFCLFRQRILSENREFPTGRGLALAAETEVHSAKRSW